METIWNICLIDVAENILFTYLHSTGCLDTSRKIRVDNIFLSFLIMLCQKFKVSPLSPDFRVEADLLKCAAPQTQVALLAS